jgi:hypothetical protein
MDYPRQWDFTSEELCMGTFPPNRSELAAAVVQSWLSFGLMEEVFDTSIPEADFTTASASGQLLLSMANLHKYGGAWQERCSALNEAAKLSIRARLSKSFRECSRFFRLFLRHTKNQYPATFNTYLNHLAILVEILRHWTIHVIGLGDEPEPLPSTLVPEATDALISRGWCRFAIANLLLPFHSPSLFAYATFFARFPSSINQNHAACTRTQCTATDVDVATYKPRHNPQYCTEKDGMPCNNASPDMDTLTDLLKKGKIPVVTLTDKGIKVLPHDDGPYIAVSHVWSDGMGSTSEAGLPECQVRFLSSAATAALAYEFASRESSDSILMDFEAGNPNAGIPFWVDALCVPAEVVLRKRAITLMAKTYADAAAVVVIDSALRQLSITTSAEEQLFTLYFSNWVRRLWTLQEALLAKKLFIHLHDGIMDVVSFFEMDNRFQVPAFFELWRWLQKLLGVPIARQKGKEEAILLDDLILHLANRTSSRPEDETLAIAALFGLDVGQYVNLDPEERMIKFLIEHNESKVRFDILFVKGEKLLVQGFSWAPKSFLNRPLDVIVRGKWQGGWAIISDKGLVGTDYYCLLLESRWAEEAAPRNYCACGNNGEMLAVRFSHSIDPEEEELETYDALLLQRRLRVGEDGIAATLKVELKEERPDGTMCLHLELVGFAGVVSDDPVARTENRVEIKVEEYAGLVIIS